MQRYIGQDPSFATTREAKFINVLIDAVDAGDVDTFTGAVYEFDQVVKLDNWKTDILLKVKRGIQEPGLT
jgi:alpha-soluble NSF attachment protein